MNWRAAEDAGYDVLLTVDQGIPHQHSFAGRKLSIVIIRPRTNQIEDLLPLAAVITEALRLIEAGQTVTVSAAERLAPILFT